MADPVPAAEPTVTVQAPSGEYGAVPASKLADAVQAGYRPETQQQTAARMLSEKEGLGGAARTFGENAASTATLGLYDVAAGGLGGDEYRQNRALRDIANPTAKVLGQTAGMVAPAFIPGGAEAEAAEAAGEGAEAANAAAHAGSGVVSKALQAAGKYSPSGLALRAGEGATELAGSTLGKLGLGGDSFLSRMAMQGGKMAAGGATEGAMFGAGSALSEAALAPGGDYDDLGYKLLAGAGEGAKFGAMVGGGLGAGSELLGSAARKLGGTFSAREALERLGNEKTMQSAGLTGGDMAKLGQKKVGDLADALRREDSIGWADSLADRAKKINVAREEAGNTLGKMREELDKIAQPGEGPNVSAVLEKADNDATQLMRTAPTAGTKKTAQKLSDEIAAMRENIGDRPITFDEAHQLRRTLDDEMTNYGRSMYPASGANRAPDLFEHHMMALRTGLEGEFENAAQKVMDRAAADGSGAVEPNFIKAYHDAKSRYGALKEIGKITNKRAGMVGGSRTFGLTDTIMAGSGFAALGPKGLLLAAANKALRSTQADHVIGKLADALARTDNRINGAMKGWVSESREAAKGVVEAPPHQRAVREALKKTGEVGKTTTSAGLHVHAGAAEHAEKVAAYNETLNHYESEKNAPPGELIHIPDAPKTQAAAEKVRKQQVSWLLGQASVPPGTITQPMLARIARQLPPTAAQITSFNRKVEVVENPLSVLEKIKNGSLTADHVKALEATNPPILQMIREAAIEHATSANEDMSYKDKITLGTLLGVVTDPSLRPESIAAGQAPYKARAQQSQGAPQGGPSVQGRQMRGLPSRVDELEEGGAIH